MAEAKEKRVSFFAPAALHKDAKSKAASLGTSFQQILLPYFEKWTRGDRAAEPSVPHVQGKGSTPIYRAENIAWHDRLEAVLNDGTEDDRQGIEQNLKWAVESVERRSSAPSRKRAGK